MKRSNFFQDPQMFDEACQKRVECRALNIPEELGQVSHDQLESSVT